MQLPVQITLREMAPSEALDTRIRAKAAKLAEFHSNITSCRVTVEESGKHHRQGRHFKVNVDVRVPGREFVANHDHDEDIYIALREAFAAVRRQIDEHVRVQQGHGKAHKAAPQEETE